MKTKRAPQPAPAVVLPPTVVTHVAPALPLLADKDLAGRDVLPCTTVSLLRDVSVFIDFVRREGIKRSHRGNQIPKGPATKLAQLLSSAAEVAAVAAQGRGVWSHEVSCVALGLGLVRFNQEGIYVGYSSTEPSFPENHIEICEAQVQMWNALSALEREQRLLEHLIKTRSSEFFYFPTLFERVPGYRFDGFGRAVGPAARMDLGAARRGLLDLLAKLPVGVFLPTRALVDHVQACLPDLILPPGLAMEPPRPGWRRVAEKLDLYSNSREHRVKNAFRNGDQLSEAEPGVWRRVNGRYIHFFLQEIPFLCGYVDLILAPRPTRPMEVLPPLEEVYAFRVSPRLRQVLRGDPELSRVTVTVMPNFEVLLLSASYPAGELAALMPYCKLVKEDTATYTHILRLDRAAIMAHASLTPGPPVIVPLLERLSGRAVPPNVATEIAGWCGQAEKLTLYEGLALVELRGPAGLSAELRRELGGLVPEDQVPGFLLVKDPDCAVAELVTHARAPQVFVHTAERFVAPDGPLAAAEAKGKAAAPAGSKPCRGMCAPRAALQTEDLQGYRCQDQAVLEVLRAALDAAGVACHLISGSEDAEGLLVVAASAAPAVRAALRKME